MVVESCRPSYSERIDHMPALTICRSLRPVQYMSSHVDEGDQNAGRTLDIERTYEVVLTDVKLDGVSNAQVVCIPFHIADKRASFD